MLATALIALQAAQMGNFPVSATIRNEAEVPICVNARVMGGPFHEGLWMRTGTGRELQDGSVPTTIVTEPPVAASWLVVAPNSAFSFDATVWVHARLEANETVTAVRLPYWSLPCDFVLERFVYLAPDAPVEQAIAIDREADRLVQYGYSEWSELTSTEAAGD